MMLPPVIRIFFAINLPSSAKQMIGRFIGQLKKKSKSHAIRWTKPENLHITLHFLPEVWTIHLEEIISYMRAQLRDSITSFVINFGSVILFPNPFRPRVIVLEILPQDELSQLMQNVGNAIQKTNYKIDSRPFRAHLTLGRIKHMQSIHLDFLKEFSRVQFEKIKIEEIVLFRSEPQPQGSKYTPLEIIQLDRP